MGMAGSPVVSLAGRPRSIPAGTAHTEGQLCGAGNPEGPSVVKAGPPRATDPWGSKSGGTHLAGPCFGLTDLRVAMAATAFTGAQVEATGHAGVACVTVLGAGRRQWEGLPQQAPFWAATTGWRGWGGLGKVERAKGGRTREHHRGSWLDRCVGPRAHLAGWASVPGWAGALFYFQCRVLASVLRHGHVHADARDPGRDKTL